MVLILGGNVGLVCYRYVGSNLELFFKKMESLPSRMSWSVKAVTVCTSFLLACLQKDRKRGDVYAMEETRNLLFQKTLSGTGESSREHLSHSGAGHPFVDVTDGLVRWVLLVLVFDVHCNQAINSGELIKRSASY